MNTRRHKPTTIDGQVSKGKGEFQPERYNTSHLDRIDGHVSDFNYEAPQPPALYQRPNLVLPQHQELPAMRQGPDIAPNEAGIIGGAIGYALQMVSNVTGRAAQSDSADTLANAQIKTGALVVVVCLIITAGLCSVAGYVLRTQANITFPIVFWIGVYFLTWGGMTYWALRDNHRRIMDHSGSGVERLRIVESNETARAITNRAFDALERKWGVHDDQATRRIGRKG